MSDCFDRGCNGCDDCISPEGDEPLACTTMATVADLDAIQTDAYAEGRKDEQAELASVLPGTYYMDPPDGGSVTVLEQLHRMAEDARKWRECRESALQEFAMESAQNTRLMDAIAPILESGHMNQEDLARLRAVYESIIPFDAPLPAEVPYPPSLDNVTIYNPYGPMSMDPTDGQPVEHYWDREGLREYGARCIVWAAANFQAPGAAPGAEA